MFRQLRLILAVCMLSIVISGPGPRPVNAAAPRSVTPGLWTGKFTRIITATNTKPDLVVTSTSKTVGVLNLIIAGDNITGTFGSIEADVEYSFTGGGTSKSDACKITAVYDLVSGIVQQSGDALPTLVLNYTGRSNGTGFCNMPSTNSGSMTLPASRYTGDTMSGEEIIWSDPGMGQAVSNMESAGAEVQIEEYWELSSKSPALGALTPTYIQYFLQELPFDNIYKAEVDWNGLEPGSVDFTLNGVKKSDTSGLSSAQQTFTIGDQPLGNNPLTAVAMTKNQVPSQPVSVDVYLVEQPQWAKDAGFSPVLSGNYILYKGKTNFPEEPIEAYVSIPNIIPFIGGEWGILPTQLIANISATSLGGNAQGDITGDGGMGFGSRKYKLTIDGKTNTLMSQDSLEFLPSTANFKLSPPVSYQKKVGLLDIIPDASGLFQVPIIGDAMEAINSIASITGDVGLKVSGEGVLDDDTQLEALMFTSGKVRTDASVSVFLMLDAGVAYAQITGQGYGYIVYQVTPDVTPTDCSVNLAFLAEAGLAKFIMKWFDLQPAFYSKKWNPPLCEGSASNGIGVLAIVIPNKTPLFPDTVSLIQNDQVQVETLVENADIQAGPSLALAPDGTMAYAWMAVDPAEHISEIHMRWFDGTQWGEEAVLNSGSKINFSPSVGIDPKGQVVAVWPQSKMENVASINDAFSKSIDVAYAVYNPKTGKVVSEGSLSDDDVLDITPRLVRSQDGTLWAMWQSSPSGTMTGNKETPNLLKAAYWNGKKWSEVQTAADNLVGTLWWSLAAGNGEALVAYDVDMNGDLNDATDREIFVARSTDWGKTQQVTDNDILDTSALAAYSLDGQPILAWLNGSQVVSVQGDLEGTPSVWFDDEKDLGLSLTRAALLPGKDGEMGLLLPGGSEAGPDTWLYILDPASKKWTRQELPLFGNPEVENNLTAGLTPGGDILVGFSSIQMMEQAGVPVLADTATLKVATVKSVLQPMEAVSMGTAPNSSATKIIIAVVLALICGLALLGILIGAFFLLRKRKQPKKSN